MIEVKTKPIRGNRQAKRMNNGGTVSSLLFNVVGISKQQRSIFAQKKQEKN